MQTKEIISITKKLRLLYVEDDDASRDATLELLENFFDSIFFARDGQEGINLFKEHEFDIVLSDINMPKVTGLEMLEQIRFIDKDIPVLFLSAHNTSDYLSDGVALGIDGYLMKPLKLNNLLVVLVKICERIEYKRFAKEYQNTLELEVSKKTQELDKKLYIDELTGIFNRYSFFEDIKSVITPIVFIVDINKFKIINEIYGSEVGSVVLKEFALFLKEFTQDTSYRVYRLSGDEFIIRDTVDYIDHEKYEKDMKRFFNSIHDFHVLVDGESISIEVTIGISTSQTDAFECAKIALDYAKARNRPYEMYSMSIDKRSEAQDALAWKERTKSAIEDGRIVPVYQPIVDIHANPVKYEALMRLKNEETGELITPFFFLDIAIKTGLYSALSSHIIFESLHLLDTSSHVISFNFTYGDIKNETLINEIEAFLKISPNIGNRAVFEIVESENIESYADIKYFIKKFRKYGVRFAIDDFGSGFSNFEYILEIEPDYLKIDGSLVKNIDIDEKAHILVSAIVGFSHKLGIKVIAEYVHSKVIFEMLKKLDVDEYQGFYFSEPLENIKEIQR
ncbi:EAL domain-containing protein [Sulfurimonas sp. SAG-AH-194-I05]|nr:EAL domain-containing response regulator [Sulfurimonas sp. SAG-AH-194-I05]MDF1875356.1 EAL domain-containing protein [Sulfurimonas sp. SAG-AH-194-I05]